MVRGRVWLCSGLGGQLVISFILALLNSRMGQVSHSERRRLRSKPEEKE
jgi:hypothetical protein